MIDASNPMNLFNKSAPPDQVAALRELYTLLGSLGSPSLPVKQPQPQLGQMAPILGGLGQNSYG